MVENMETIVNLCKSRGYIYPGSEIYGGLANTWDYGPLGVELKNNVKSLWRKKFIQEQKNIVGLDAAILMNPETWVASGHLSSFCKKGGARKVRRPVLLLSGCLLKLGVIEFRIKAIFLKQILVCALFDNIAIFHY